VSFDAVAPWYRTLETVAFGDALQRARLACLAEIQPPTRVLIVGEGNGRFLLELLRMHPSTEIDCVDASGRMLELARQRIGDECNRVRFLHRDITAWAPPEGNYDLIVTHFVLDCFPSDQLAEMVETLSRAATADANWLLADFSLPARGFARIRARAWLAVMYRFFRLAARIEAKELVDPSSFLRANGFVLFNEHRFRGDILRSQRWRRRV
jgi:ubiquinone/menaquinone biosynthesis C-methylase UbiE